MLSTQRFVQVLVEGEYECNSLKRQLSFQSSELFKILDVEQRSYITIQGLSMFLRNHFIMYSQNELEFLIKKIDYDRDGRIYYKDLVDYLRHINQNSQIITTYQLSTAKQFANLLKHEIFLYQKTSRILISQDVELLSISFPLNKFKLLNDYQCKEEQINPFLQFYGGYQRQVYKLDFMFIMDMYRRENKNQYYKYSSPIVKNWRLKSWENQYLDQQLKNMLSKFKDSSSKKSTQISNNSSGSKMRNPNQDSAKKLQKVLDETNTKLKVNFDRIRSDFKIIKKLSF